MQSLRGGSAKQKFIKEDKDVRVLVYTMVTKKINNVAESLIDKYYQFLRV